jgi:NRPS condensation-like uncharacterized protein
LRIPCSKSKRYLSGDDWLVNALHDIILKETGLGNSSMIILEMEGVFELEDFRKTVRQVTDTIPFFTGSVRRDWTLAPFWASSRKKNANVPVIIETIGDDIEQEAILVILEEWANKPFEGDQDYLCFRILQVGSNRCYLTMQFDHRIFDAYGAESFLSLLGKVFSKQIKPDQICKEIRLTEPAHLDHWRDNFLSGQAVIRSRYKLLEKPNFFPTTPYKKQYQDHISIFLNAEETLHFQNQVQNHAGYLMTLPYGLYVAVMIFRYLTQSMNTSQEDILVSCSVDQRYLSPNQPTIFFNYLSFMFFKVNQACLDNRPGLIQSLKQQFYENTKEKFPEKLSNVMLLMRILPKKILGKLLSSWMSVFFGSLNFAFLQKCNIAEGLFCGRRVINVFHYPRIPLQTGAGIYFNKFGKHLNMSITLHRGMIDQEQRKALITFARDVCLG